MSLNWDLSKIDDHDQLFEEREATPTQEGGRYLNALTESLIWTSMVTGLGKGWSLDAEFAPEFYARIKLYERVAGPLIRRWDEDTKGFEPYFVTIDDIRRHIGLKVNVSSVTRAAFIKNLVTRDLDRDKRDFLKEVSKPVEA